jgi:hypothetical protein
MVRPERVSCAGNRHVRDVAGEEYPVFTEVNARPLDEEIA